MISLKYEDVTIFLDEQNGKYSMEGNIASYDWLEIKRKIDKFKKQKYKQVEALWTGGYRGGPQVVTVTRPVIGSNDRVWITKSDKRRETVSSSDLVDISFKDEYMALEKSWQELESKQAELGKQMRSIKRADKPEPIE